MLWEQYKELKAKLIAFEKEKNALTRQIEPCQRLMEIEGVGKQLLQCSIQLLVMESSSRMEDKLQRLLVLHPNNTVQVARSL
ncbi:Mobile element protein [Vibrio crassostreae]|uniref:Mobile element protein n=1 Tax=Vibrio tasmaniensis TaxID=212663 RepID=A0A0H3ZS51_9VIBR|nr:Mobile element protein [Vibrio tasmaniensis]CAK2108968.1 Mobile element protein [Vibrio crassostreae]CAK2132637.1 Mobile element protein [Vibrio crassostreae]CAK2987576.1 Mobile element protein [Vibrio crassostreae]CAK3507334.1 Mobile element protein [Vibrio crassostreae]